MAFRFTRVGARSRHTKATAPPNCEAGQTAEVPNRGCKGVYSEMVPVIESPPYSHLKNIGRHMSRDRYQHGWVEETGKKVKKWKGHYYVYVLTIDGKEKRKHRSVVLGLKGEMRKWEGERELAKIIERESRGTGHPKPDP